MSCWGRGFKVAGIERLGFPRGALFRSGGWRRLDGGSRPGSCGGLARTEWAGEVAAVGRGRRECLALERWWRDRLRCCYRRLWSGGSRFRPRRRDDFSTFTRPFFVTRTLLGNWRGFLPPVLPLAIGDGAAVTRRTWDCLEIPQHGIHGARVMGTGRLLWYLGVVRFSAGLNLKETGPQSTSQSPRGSQTLCPVLTDGETVKGQSHRRRV